MKKIFIVIVFCLLSFYLFAVASDAQTIRLTSPVYRQMDMLYATAGLGTPSNSRPWSLSEARLILKRIDVTALPQSAKILFDSISEEINAELRWQMGNDFNFGSHLSINPEIYAHTNSTDFIKETDWVRGFEERRHFATADVEMSIGTFFYTYCDLVYGYGRYGAADEDADHFVHIQDYPALALPGADPSMIGTVSILDSVGALGYMSTSAYFYTQNFLFNLCPTINFDFQWPKRAMVSVGGANWNVTIGRDRLDWGNSHIGNLVVDNHIDYHDFFRFNAFAERFKYDFLAIALETDPRHGERPAQATKTLLAHRLEFRITPTFVFAVSEDVMYQTEVVGLQYLNPAMIFHNFNNRSMFNAIAHAELDWQATRNLNFYGQFALDQATAPNESNSQSGAWGVLGGVEFTLAKDKFLFTSSLEGAYTTPLLYRRDVVDFIVMMKNFSQRSVSYVVSFDYLGFPYGGDSVVLDFSNTLEVPNICTINLNIRGLLHGEMNIYQSHSSSFDNTEWPDRLTGKTTSGDKQEQMLFVSLSGETRLNNFKYPEIYLLGEIDAVFRRTYIKSTGSIQDQACDFQFSFGMSFAL